MFVCQHSGEISDSREKPVRLVVETRAQQYVNEIRGDEREVIRNVTTGTEIVKEVIVRARHVDAAKKRFGLA